MDQEVQVEKFASGVEETGHFRGKRVDVIVSIDLGVRRSEKNSGGLILGARAEVIEWFPSSCAALGSSWQLPPRQYRFALPILEAPFFQRASSPDRNKADKIGELGNISSSARGASQNELHFRWQSCSDFCNSGVDAADPSS
jgi:hypothetical protein